MSSGGRTARTVNKKCFVKACTNSSVRTPQKEFIMFPRSAARRRDWFTSLGESPESFSVSTNLFVCEDHFDLKENMENYTQWKLQGGRKILKLDALPKVLHLEFHNSSGVREPLRDITASIKPNQPVKETGKRRDVQNKNDSDSESDISIQTASSYQPSSTSHESQESTETEQLLCLKFKNMALEVTMHLLQQKPLRYMGLNENCYFTLQFLQQCVPCILRDICIAMLGDDFGLSESHTSRVFKNCLPLICTRLKHFIIKCEKQRVLLLLPVPFRIRYSKVHFIIDCLEIQIQKPSDPVQQALTWSEYKKCNTVKYLVASTPDGVINYISPGYGGRTSDCLIVEDSGFLDYLIPDTMVKADRGFKHIEYQVLERGCCFVRPPSESADTPSTREEVMETKKLRVYGSMWKESLNVYEISRCCNHMLVYQSSKFVY